MINYKWIRPDVEPGTKFNHMYTPILKCIVSKNDYSIQYFKVFSCGCYMNIYNYTYRQFKLDGLEINGKE